MRPGRAHNPHKRRWASGAVIAYAASSNADAQDRTDANHREHIVADHSETRTTSDRLNTDRVRLLIRGVPQHCLCGGGALLRAVARGMIAP